MSTLAHKKREAEMSSRSSVHRFLSARTRLAGFAGVLASVGLLASPGHAAEGTQGHGGNAVFCPQRPPVVLDYYHSTLGTLSGPADTVDISAMTKDQVVQFFVDRL